MENTSRRQRTTLKLMNGAIVCQDTEVLGDVTIDSGTVIHPRAKIVAEAGPIIIGRNNIIEEQVTIINRLPLSEAPSAAGMAEPATERVMVIGNGNLFEVGCFVESTRIGDDNVVECKARLGVGVELTSGCVVGAMCNVQTTEVIPANMVVFGSRPERRIQADKPQSQAQQLEFLSKMLPNYHRLRKGTTQPPKP